jgi:hypothetical protein
MRHRVIRWPSLAAVDDGARRLNRGYGLLPLLMHTVLYAAPSHLGFVCGVVWALYAALSHLVC